MKTDLSIDNFIRIRVASRLLDLLFDELEKMTLDGAPPTTLRIRIAALEGAQAVRKSILDLLQGIPGDITTWPEHN